MSWLGADKVFLKRKKKYQICDKNPEAEKWLFKLKRHSIHLYFMDYSCFLYLSQSYQHCKHIEGENQPPFQPNQNDHPAAHALNLKQKERNQYRWRSTPSQYHKNKFTAYDCNDQGL